MCSRHDDLLAFFSCYGNRRFFSKENIVFCCCCWNNAVFYVRREEMLFFIFGLLWISLCWLALLMAFCVRIHRALHVRIEFRRTCLETQSVLFTWSRRDFLTSTWLIMCDALDFMNTVFGICVCCDLRPVTGPQPLAWSFIFVIVNSLSPK